MPVFRINKNKNYTVMCNYHLKDKRISLKAKGLISVMLSLPEKWNYSINGLTKISKESERAIKTTLKELKEYNYLIITKERDKKGKFKYIYDIFERPDMNKKETETEIKNNPEVRFPPLDERKVENVRQLNTNILNTKNKKKYKRKSYLNYDQREYSEEIFRKMSINENN